MPAHPPTGGDGRRQKLAELTSTVGAGVLGGGLALLLQSYLAPYTVPLVALGGFLHAWGMLDRHRLERQLGVATPRWIAALYWICWFSLAGLALYIAVAIRGS